MTTSTTTTRRAAAVVLGAVAGAAVWGVAHALHGDITVPTGGSPSPVTLAMVLAAAVVAALAGWGLLAAAERWAPRLAARRTVVAVGVAVLSLAGPLGMPDIATADRVWLALVHVAVAVGVVPLVSSTVATSTSARPTPAPAGAAH